MSIEIGTLNGKPYVKSEFDKCTEKVQLSDLEQEFLTFVLNYFKSTNHQTNTITYQRRTDSYLSVLANDNYDSDFLRLKITDRTKWFSFDAWIDGIDEFKNSPELSAVTNKNQRHWKVKLNQVSDVNNYLNIILKSFVAASIRKD